ncbi:MAG TPA: S8 family serine peptidase [Streptosporangiaceae bacterium]|nr:S8 family serine peptidase [Streptosporangiaceae bacterium]
MLTRRPARRAIGGLLVLTVAGAGPVLATGQPALADSVRSAQQWVLDAVDAPTAWPVTQGSGVLVAVIDSGVQPDVSDLSGSVTSGPDLSGVGTPASDANWGMHGTWMASLIAGHGHGPGGSDGISGVAPQAKILSIRVLPDKKDPGYTQYKHESSSRGQHALAQAIRYAVAHHASVISMSLGYGASSRVVRAALQDATRHGVVVVASSGNSGTPAKGDGKAHAPYSFPADYPGVLGVAAVDRSGSPASFSSDNLSVQIAAPGVKVPAEGSDGQYWLVSGTSPACALTAGVAALIKSVYPHLAPALVIRAITISAQNQPKLGYDDRVGFGTLDAAVALKTAGKLTGFGVTGRGIGVHSHFGGGPKAIPPAPIGRRGSGQLLLFGGLGLACLILSLIAAGRLLLYRRRVTAAQGAPPPGPSYPGATPPAPAYLVAQPRSAQPGPNRPAPSYPATHPPAAPATSWWTQDNGTRPPGPVPAPGRDQPDRTVAGPPHLDPSSPPLAQLPAVPAPSWWSQDNRARPPGPAPEPDRDEADRTVPGPQPPRSEPHQSPAAPPADRWSQGNGTRPPGPAPAPDRGEPTWTVANPQPPRAEPHPDPSPPLAQPSADPASTWWSQGNGARPSGPTPAPDRDETDRTVIGPQPPRTEPHLSSSLPPPAAPSVWPGPSRRAEAPPSPAGPAAAARPPAGATGAPGPAGASPSGTIPDWMTSAPPPGPPGPPAQAPWPGDDDAENTSPSGIPAVPAEPAAGSPPAGQPSADVTPSAWPAPAGSPPFAPGPVRPGSAPAGSAGPSRYLQGLGRPPQSGRHAAHLDHPQPAPAWARNRPPGSQENGEEPDPQDEP